jgi:hypothetical protein
MKKLTFTHVFLSMAYVFVFIQSLRAMYQLLQDSSGTATFFANLSVAGMWCLLLLFYGAFLHQQIKHENNDSN